MVQAAECFVRTLTGVAAAANPFALRLPRGLLTDELLLELSALNDPWRFERTPEGALEISPLPGARSGQRSGRIFSQMLQWSDARQDGDCFPSGSGFSLPTGSARDPDAAWVSSERLDGIDPDDEGIWPVCPDLVVEVRSRGQALGRQQRKMEEWLRAGARLGWLIDPFTSGGAVWVYRQSGGEPDRLDRPDSISGEDVAEGLSVDLTKVWR